ncbi:TIGR03773 family transporter-associated surface protein [Dactylosporangium sp. CA-152071]|uniref:TIGR03773 family transporter-associated surface protein n=1 Tax=Dactylosporangium sp. CA-152071 TaxID=3239933 RepID=UPI003D8B6DB1
MKLVSVSSSRRRFGVVLAVAGALVAMLGSAAVPVSAATGAPAPPSRQRTVLNDVHTDLLFVDYTDGGLDVRTRIGNGDAATFADPADVLVQLFDTDTSRLAVPDLPDYAFLGAAGEPMWLAPEIQDYALVWPGWSTEGIEPGAITGDSVRFHLREVRGPGRVEIFASGPVGEPLRYFSSTDPAYTSGSWPVMTHAHANWVFTALGRYVLTFEVTATRPDGRTISSGPVEVAWYVGGTSTADIPATPTSTNLTPPPATSVAGEPVTLAATVEPAGADGWVEYLDGTTVLGHQPVTTGAASLTVTGLAAGEHQLAARFVPRYSTDFTPSAAPAVAHQVTGGSPSAAPSSSPVPSPTSSHTASPETTTTTPATTVPATSTAAPRPTSCAPTTRTSGVVITSGHADVAVRLESGRLVTRIKDGTGGGAPVWRTPSEVVLHLGDAATATVPAGPFDFLGGQGATVWQVPQTQKAGVPWLGWNTEEAGQAGGPVTWKLTGVDGPGTVAVFEYDAFGQPKVIFNSKDGLPDSLAVPLGTHAHGNWAFTKPGAYRLSFSHTLGGSTATSVVTFAVGGTDPKTLLPRTTSTGCAAADGRLPRTGTAPSPLIGAGAAMVCAGGVLVALTYRRRRTT